MSLFFLVILLILVLYIINHKSDTSVNALRKHSETVHLVYGLWDKGPPPSLLSETCQKWKDLGYTPRIWGREEVDRLYESYPKYASLVPHFKRKVMEADLARYLILYDQGGLYSDMDCQPLGRLWKESPSELFFIENVMGPEWPKASKAFSIREGEPEHVERISNYCMYTQEAHHPKMLDILELVYARCVKNRDRMEKLTDYEVMYCTGPDCVTVVVQEDRSAVSVVPETGKINHLCAGTWKNGKDEKVSDE